jgi:hypothetical protein
MALLVVAGIIGASILLNQPTGTTDPDEKNSGFTTATDQNSEISEMMRDFNEMGISYSAIKVNNLNVTNLNDASLPFSGPYQKPTRSMRDIYSGMAQNIQLVEKFGTNFYLNEMGMIPLASAEQSNPNVEIPTENSIMGDPNMTLARFPRVMIDRTNTKGNPYPYTNPMNSAGNMPTETEVKYVPNTGKLNRLYNPWGPGGTVQKLASAAQESEVRLRGTNQSRIIKGTGRKFNGQ